MSLNSANGRVRLGGADVSHYVSAWSASGRVGEIRRVTLEFPYPLDGHPVVLTPVDSREDGDGGTSYNVVDVSGLSTGSHKKHAPAPYMSVTVNGVDISNRVLSAELVYRPRSQSLRLEMLYDPEIVSIEIGD